MNINVKGINIESLFSLIYTLCVYLLCAMKQDEEDPEPIEELEREGEESLNKDSLTNEREEGEEEERDEEGSIIVSEGEEEGVVDPWLEAEYTDTSDEEVMIL